jgi:archaellin
MIMNKKQSSVVVLVAIIAAALVVTSSMTTAPVAATTTSNTTTTTSASSGIELSSQPVYQDQLRVISQNPINETHMSITFSGNGTLTLPNTTQAINTTSNGSALISFMTLSVQGKETIRTQDGETATATLYEIDQQPGTTGESKGIVIAMVNTNATSGMLAPLNGMILAGLDDIQTTTSESRLTLWEWKSGIGKNAGVVPPT